MKYWTGEEVKEKVRRDLGLQQEEFVGYDEFLTYINDAIDEAEAEILTLYEDYFLPEPASVDIVSGQKEYDLPEDIYANKVRGVVYVNGTDVYPVKEFKPSRDFFTKVMAHDQSTGNNYRFKIYNNAGTEKPKLHLYPTPSESVTGGLNVFYIRNANRLEAYTDSIDIPEFASFIIQYCKYRCYEKEGHPNTELALNKLEQYREQMTSTLSNMVPDGDTDLEMDTDFYDETV